MKPDKALVTTDSVWALLDTVTDPEIPVVSLREMGILRDVTPNATGFDITLTPTYSGCPAMDQMVADVENALRSAELSGQVRIQLAPAWTTDWMSPSALNKLREYGIAPPHTRPASTLQPIGWSIPSTTKPSDPVACPQCSSTDTTEISHFGSTACKALYRCLSCLEPFDYFKPY